MKGISLFSGAGIGEYFLKNIGMNVLVANELVEKRGKLYSAQYPFSQMIIGDIREHETFQKVISKVSGERINFLMASPPCQGISVAGKNRSQSEFIMDERNYLFFKIIEIMNSIHPDVILIENVPHILQLMLPYRGKIVSVLDILHEEFRNSHTIEAEIIDSSEYGIPQTRNRAIIKIYKKGIIWPWPTKEKKVTVLDSIGMLPSLEANERSSIKWHFARNHAKRHVLWMKHTPTGDTAFNNKIYFPQKKDGSKIKGYESCYRRIRWDRPAPTITIRSDAISSQRNVHPGRLLEDGTYSDARVLTPLEIMRLNSLPDNWAIPDDTPELLIRQCIGESIPPLLINKIMQGLI